MRTIVARDGSCHRDQVLPSMSAQVLTSMKFIVYPPWFTFHQQHM